MFSKDAAVLQGTIELLVLKRLSQGPMHGYGIASWIETATDDVLRVEEGSLYPALYRMVQKRWIKGEWGVSENNRRAKLYRLTPSGEREFEQQATGWLRLSDAVSRAVTTTGIPVPRGRR
jgi:transcriptional regulator